jgi:hypothetical protein
VRSSSATFTPILAGCWRAANLHATHHGSGHPVRGVPVVVCYNKNGRSYGKNKGPELVPRIAVHSFPFRQSVPDETTHLVLI